jgi:hypothetical protein
MTDPMMKVLKVLRAGGRVWSRFEPGRSWALVDLELPDGTHLTTNRRTVNALLRDGYLRRRNLADRTEYLLAAKRA